ncbi:MAG: hypothetical protein H6577_25130 [Lewinellaceae bacterium]|nr:hypothetical protein [Saprospiraceae bacterium]MCB9341422.1 hypothetical protein [Lewinellaceae bacterium]
MNKKQKIIIGLLAAAILVAVAGRFLRLPLLNVHPEEAIPQHTALLLAFKPEALGAWGQKKEVNLAEIFVPEALRLDLADFQKLMGKNKNLPGNPIIWAAVQPTRSSGMDVLFVLENKGSIDPSKWLSSQKNWRIRTSIFKNHEVMSVEAEGQKFAVANYRNLLLLARHAYLIENAISQIKSPSNSLCRDGDFKKIASHTAPDDDGIQVFLNLRTFNAQFAPLLNPSKLLAMEGLEKVGSWAAFYFPARKKFNEWQGAFTANPDNVLLAANLRASGHSFKDAFRALPDNLTFFNWFAVKNIKPDFKAGDWSKYFQPWVGGEIVLALGEPLEDNEAEQFILLQAKKADKAEASLAAYAGKAGNLGEYDFQLFKVRQLLGTEVPEMLGLGKRMPNPYVTVLGEYVLFSNSKPGLERWLGKYLAGQTFSKNVRFLQSLRSLPVEADGFLYFESSKLWQQLSQLPDERLLPALGGNPFQFGHLAATMERKGNLCNLTFSVSTAGQDGEQAATPASILWKVPLAAKASMAPVVFKNPQNGEMEVFIQDENNQIYLVSKSGRILWRRKLDGPIRSKVEQIELHNNREGQFAFSTGNGIYLVDRLGEDIAGFPLKLQTNATNGVTVIDFFNSHDYQFFIACENGNAYGFDEKGSPVEGWRPKKGIGYVRLPLYHYQAAGKDFMVLLDTTGRMQVFQKNGEERFPEKKLETVFLQAPDFQEEKGYARMVACDEHGKVFVTNLNGDQFGLNLKVGKNEAVLFLFADVTGDERKDYIGASGADLAAYFYEGKDFKKKFDYQFRDIVDGIFSVKWQKSKKDFIGAFCKNRRQIYLLDGEGRLFPQFPLAGTTAFSISDLLGDGIPVVVVGNEESVFAYRME